MTIHSLYIHLPWCLKKCPYCDFNSYPLGQNKLPEGNYVNHIIANFRAIKNIWDIGELTTIYFGGGTPSLFTTDAIKRILDEINQVVGISNLAEISMEINPGTASYEKFKELHNLINRISFGVQSFNDSCLKEIRRIHNAEEAKKAVLMAQDAGFSNINIDLMHGLPGQDVQIAIQDLKIATDLNISHLSWYELTIEEDTAFGLNPPQNLPNSDVIDEIEEKGLEFLNGQSFNRYEISAFTRGNKPCQHNLTYWNYLDYVGIGAGAHGKYTNIDTGNIERIHQEENPNLYIKSNSFTQHMRKIPDDEVPFEYLLNTTRLFNHKITFQDYLQKTGKDPEILKKRLIKAHEQGFILLDNEGFSLTNFGHNFTNHFLESFLPE